VSCTRENGLLTCGNEFSNGVFGGVSTWGDSDGLRARAPRSSSVREERSDAKDVGKIASLLQRGFHFVSVLRRDWRTTGEKPASKTAAYASTPKLVLGTISRERFDDEMPRWEICLALAILLIVGAMWTCHESVVIQSMIQRIKDHDLLNINSKRASLWCLVAPFGEWSVPIDRYIERYKDSRWTLSRGIADSTWENGSSATPHSSARKGDKSPASSNRSSLRSISRYPSDRCKFLPKVVKPGIDNDLDVHPKIESPRGNARARERVSRTRCAIFENQCREVNDPRSVSPQTGNGIPEVTARWTVTAPPMRYSHCVRFLSLFLLSLYVLPLHFFLSPLLSPRYVL